MRPEAIRLPSVLPAGSDSSQPESMGTSRPASRPLATFVAQLIATAQGVPQTRARRRAGPDDAIALYSAAGRNERRCSLERLL
jgi:hypothetical protein